MTHGPRAVAFAAAWKDPQGGPKDDLTIQELSCRRRLGQQLPGEHRVNPSDPITGALETRLTAPAFNTDPLLETIDTRTQPSNSSPSWAPPQTSWLA
jgi:hypothetical protein